MRLPPVPLANSSACASGTLDLILSCRALQFGHPCPLHCAFAHGSTANQNLKDDQMAHACQDGGGQVRKYLDLTLVAVLSPPLRLSPFVCAL